MFRRLAGRPGLFWLDSSLRRGADSRYSIIGCAPRWVFSARGDHWTLTGDHLPEQRGTFGSLQQLERLLSDHRAEPPAESAHLPFHGGAIGWLAYDLGRQFEALNGTAVDDRGVADIRLAWHDAAFVWDHEMSVTWVVGVDGVRPAKEAVAELVHWALAEPSQSADERPAVPIALHSNLTRSDYTAGVRCVRDGIARGEFYQLNLLQRFTGEYHESPAATYFRLRDLNPAPFSAYLDAGEVVVLSSSPERFLTVTPAGEVLTCPIKGTRPRGATPEADAAMMAELTGSEKERAELLMIVDLLRNDLGRVSVPGSVQVSRLHDLETFATVHHLVGEVRGHLRSDVTRPDLLRAVFPGGSITGAPKVSAMQAIDRLEPHRRGVAMGCLGYFGADGRIDLNIAIRTIVVSGRQVDVSVGAGIVWDSDPESEYQETLAKGRALFTALRATPVGTRKRLDSGEWSDADRPRPLPSDVPGVFETLLVEGGEPVDWIEHWQRFERGCAWFNVPLPMDEQSWRKTCQSVLAVNQLRSGVLRYAAWRSSRPEWQVDVEPPRPHMSLPSFRVTTRNGLGSGFAADGSHAHKHLSRGRWLAALADARAGGWDEVLLSTDDGALIEGAVSNVFFVDGAGVLHTPSLDSGPLPGIMREKVRTLARELGWKVEERRCRTEELRSASEVWLTNSLIGVLPVSEIDGLRLPASHPMLDQLRERRRQTLR